MPAPSSLNSADLADYVTRVLRNAPPLTAAQQDRLAVIFRPTPRASSRAA
ncbi:hypothetical protein SAMN05660350_01081 [Geodermatophilus obscurus]|uniref:Uncharacterized protein n=1 Tax=Geodermatophilus obscurus TaxID=1861 RepID=A0A1M7SW06_9ACTN|nr:hypothetical protein [Geodermatophilus obscurus]SHN62659.1 hypothetical protein SAMN05660350_01081 [Geodermatophilus obscurus]